MVGADTDAALAGAALGEPDEAAISAVFAEETAVEEALAEPLFEALGWEQPRTSSARKMHWIAKDPAGPSLTAKEM